MQCCESGCQNEWNEKKRNDFAKPRIIALSSLLWKKEWMQLFFQRSWIRPTGHFRYWRRMGWSTWNWNKENMIGRGKKMKHVDRRRTKCSKMYNVPFSQSQRLWRQFSEGGRASNMTCERSFLLQIQIQIQIRYKYK